jgi:multidrug efflux pump subunit AcrA (membrane-fusion protein)
MCRTAFIASLLLVSLSHSLPAEEAGSKSPTTTVTSGPFRINIALDGVFESQSMTEIILRPEEWNELKIKEVASHGKRVRAGETILVLEPTKLNETIKDLEAGRELAELSIRQNELEIAALEPLLPLDLEAAKRTNRIATEDLDRFNRIERDLTIRQGDEALKRSRQNLEMEEAELNQLEKMYKADDLTEETEEIILKRQRDAVDSARFQLEQAELTREKSRQIDIPRREEALKEAVGRQKVVLEKSRSSLPMVLAKLKLETEKIKIDRKKSTEKLEKLKHDLAEMNVKAPRDGIVYYGACTLGNWPSSTDMANKLRRGGAVQANEVLLTVVDPTKLAIRVSVPEKNLASVQSKAVGTATWGGSDDCKAEVRFTSISAVPIVSGKFTALFDLVPSRDDSCSVTPVPGMGCSVTLHAYAKKDTITVPASAVQEDKWEENKHFVFVANKDGRSDKRPVTVGKQTEQLVEILSGLSPGETILTTASED